MEKENNINKNVYYVFFPMLSTKSQNAYKSRYMKKQNNITKNGIISVFHLLVTKMLKSMENTL